MAESTLYLYPTPAGAYHAVADTDADAARHWLLRLMALGVSPPFDVATLQRLGSRADFERLRQLRMLQTCRTAYQLAGRSLEAVLPELLAALAGKGRSLLVDDQGFHLAGHGFAASQADELAGLAAELCALRRRYTGLLDAGLACRERAWALVGAGGYSQLGFWPLLVGEQCFVLILDGRPNLNQHAALELIWHLVHRYGAAAPQPIPGFADEPPKTPTARTGPIQETAICVQTS
ncbi:hypothetical protein [Pseudomonas sp. LRF_L74]|uniref:hypothetical protein n=1 Tax=Pseudomonas sp. LRF_L74 TaxID=3369422 RepID=UPI003F628892